MDPSQSPTVSNPASPGWSRSIERLRIATAGRFTILRELGRGGFATVFLAQQHKPSRRVAIKLLSPALLDSDWALEHFRGESQKIAEWRHQAVVTIYEVHEEDALLYFVMSYVEGASLHELLQLVGPLPISIVRSVLAEVGSALQYAHRQGVTHRDIKPHNILVDIDGGAVVTDFGIAKQVNGTSHTVTGMIVGTAPYMAPEQCESGKTSAASDQYALGIVAYEMLVGQPPFTGAPMAVLVAHLQQPVPCIRELRPDCPPELEAAVLRMLAKKPAERFDNVTAAVHAAGALELSDAHPDRKWFAEVAHRLAARQQTPVLDIVSMPAAIEVGESIPIGAQARTTAGEPLADVVVDWSSDAEGLVSLDVAQGRLTGIQPGRATVVVRGGGVEHHIEVEVRPPEPGTVVVQGPQKPLRVGDLGRLSATVTSHHGALVEASVHWQSAQPQLATIGPDGAIQAHAAGWVHVSASAGTAIGELWMEIAPPLVDSVRITGDSGPLHVGEHRQLAAIVLDARGQPLAAGVVHWSSSDGALAVVSATGRVTACAAGPITITAACDEQTAELTLVLREPPVTAIEVVGPSSRVHIGDRVRLHATVRAADGRALAREVSWQSNDPEIATVDADGTVTALTPGVAVVAALCEGVRSTTHLAVIPNAPNFFTAPDRGPADRPDAAPASSNASPAEAATVATDESGADTAPAAASPDRADSNSAAGVTSWMTPAAAERLTAPSTEQPTEQSTEPSTEPSTELSAGSQPPPAETPTAAPPGEEREAVPVQSVATADPRVRPASTAATSATATPGPSRRTASRTTESAESNVDSAGSLVAHPKATAGRRVRPVQVVGALAMLGLAALTTLILAPGSTDVTATDSSAATPSIAAPAAARGNTPGAPVVTAPSPTGATDASPNPTPAVQPGDARSDVPAATSSANAPAGEVAVSPLVARSPASSLRVGDSLGLRATRDGKPVRQLSWRSTNQNLATVSAAGVVRAHSGGRVAIVAAADGTADTVALTVLPRLADSQVADRSPNGQVAGAAPPRVNAPVRAPANPAVAYPPASSAGVTPPAATPVVSVEDQLRQVVAGYATALRGRSLDDAIRLYPTMSKQDRDGWLSFFDFARDLQVALRVEAASAESATASARVSGEYRYTNPATKRPCQQPLTLQMRFARSGAGWLITGIDQQQGRGSGC